MTFRLFLNGLIRNPAQFRAIAPSSRRLALAMQDELECAPGDLIVELGCGSGPFTQELDRLCQLRGWKYLGIELDATMCGHLRHRFPTREFVCASAESLPEILRARGQSRAAAILSGVPLAAMNADLQQRLVEAAARSLMPTGVFRHFTYWHYQRSAGARRLRQLLAQRFQSLRFMLVSHGIYLRRSYSPRRTPVRHWGAAAGAFARPGPHRFLTHDAPRIREQDLLWRVNQEDSHATWMVD